MSLHGKGVYVVCKSEIQCLIKLLTNVGISQEDNELPLPQLPFVERLFRVQRVMIIKRPTKPLPWRQIIEIRTNQEWESNILFSNPKMLQSPASNGFSLENKNSVGK